MTRYMRVLPPGKRVTAISARSVMVVSFPSTRGRKIWFQVFPPSFERHTPFANAEAYTIPGLTGSSATRRTPRTEHRVKFEATFFVLVQPAVDCAPLKMNFQVAPPSVDLYKPHGGAPGASDTAPPLSTDEMPRTPRVVPT